MASTGCKVCHKMDVETQRVLVHFDGQAQHQHICADCMPGVEANENAYYTSEREKQQERQRLAGLRFRRGRGDE